MACVWVGMVEVSISPTCTLELDGVGAFVWCATQAGDEQMFVCNVEKMLRSYGLLPIMFEKVQCAEELAESSEGLEEIIIRAAENPGYVLYGTFHTFNHHTA
jgi:hypothetical protein